MTKVCHLPQPQLDTDLYYFMVGPIQLWLIFKLVGLLVLLALGLPPMHHSDDCTRAVSVALSIVENLKVRLYIFRQVPRQFYLSRHFVCTLNLHQLCYPGCSTWRLV